jgi:hypothetical protein
MIPLFELFKAEVARTNSSNSFRLACISDRVHQGIFISFCIESIEDLSKVVPTQQKGPSYRGPKGLENFLPVGPLLYHLYGVRDTTAFRMYDRSGHAVSWPRESRAGQLEQFRKAGVTAIWVLWVFWATS